MKIHHNTIKKARKFGIMLGLIENDIVATKDDVTLASGPVGNKVLDAAIAKLTDGAGLTAGRVIAGVVTGRMTAGRVIAGVVTGRMTAGPDDRPNIEEIDKPKKARAKAAKKAKKLRAKARAEDDEEFDDEDGEEGDEGRSVIKRKYKTKYRPHKMTNGDEIAKLVRAHVMVKDEDTKKLRMDYAKFLRFAKANSCWDPAYKALNNGMQRMNVINRLRGKVRRDKHEIVWSA